MFVKVVVVVVIRIYLLLQLSDLSLEELVFQVLLVYQVSLVHAWVDSSKFVQWAKEIHSPVLHRYVFCRGLWLLRLTCLILELLLVYLLSVFSLLILELKFLRFLRRHLTQSRPIESHGFFSLYLLHFLLVSKLVVKHHLESCLSNQLFHVLTLVGSVG